MPSQYDNMANAKDIVTLIVEDHQKCRFLYKQYKEAKTVDEKQWLAYTIIREQSIHAIKEEEVLYPAVAKAYGKEEAGHFLQEHMIMKERLAKLSAMDPHRDEKAFDEQLASVMEEFEIHGKQEEEHELPKLRATEGVDVLQLGIEFERAAAHAPTRPHKWAPDKAPLNWFTNRLGAPLDKAMDMIRFGGNPPDVAANQETVHASNTTA